MDFIMKKMSKRELQADTFYIRFIEYHPINVTWSVATTPVEKLIGGA